MTDDGVRLDAARDRLVASFGAQQATDALLDVAGHLGLLGNALLNDSLNRLSVTIQQARIEQQQAMAEYEDAFTDRMTAIAMTEHARVTHLAEQERQRVSENRDLLKELCDRIANIEQILRLTPATPVCDRIFGTAATDEPGAWDDYDGGVGRP